MLWTSLHGIACEYIEINQFESDTEPGRWYRSPSHDCYTPGSVENRSKSTISRDMYLGLMNFIFSRKRQDLLDRTIEYGEANAWVVGDAVNIIEQVSRATITPQLYNILYDMQELLSLGTSANPPDLPLTENTDFRAHLDILRIYLSGKLYGGISDGQLETLRHQAEREPLNALYRAAYHTYTDGDQTIALELLLKEFPFPTDRLPNNHQDFCTGYIYQRDHRAGDNDDWKPCADDDYQLHSGTDFIFAASVLEGL